MATSADLKPAPNGQFHFGWMKQPPIVPDHIRIIAALDLIAGNFKFDYSRKIVQIIFFKKFEKSLKMN